MTRFSRRLSAIAFALTTAALAAAALPSASGQTYFGRHAGPGGHIFAAKAPGVYVYRGPERHGHRHHPGAIVYSFGGEPKLSSLGQPDSIDALEVVTVTRGAGEHAQLVDAICVSGGGRDMPAARAQRDTQLGAAAAAGELFRCEDGFTLRGYVSTRNKRGTEIVCSDGMSLWRDAATRVICKRKRAMPCSAARAMGACQHEAALRHAYGTGAIRIAGGRRADHPAVIVTRGMSLTGGVGLAPY